MARIFYGRPEFSAPSCRPIISRQNVSLPARLLFSRVNGREPLNIIYNLRVISGSSRMNIITPPCVRRRRLRNLDNGFRRDRTKYIICVNRECFCPFTYTKTHRPTHACHEVIIGGARNNNCWIFPPSENISYNRYIFTTPLNSDLVCIYVFRTVVFVINF